jgi:hypothetical protein
MRAPLYAAISQDAETFLIMLALLALGCVLALVVEWLLAVVTGERG